MLTLLVEQVDSCHCEEGQHNHSDPHTGVVAGNNGSCQRNGIFGDIFHVLICQTEDLGSFLLKDQVGGNGGVGGGRSDFQFGVVIPHTLCHDVLLFVHIEADGNASGHIQFAFGDTDQRLRCGTTAFGSVQIHTIFQILGTLQTQIEGNILTERQIGDGVVTISTERDGIVLATCCIEMVTDQAIANLFAVLNELVAVCVTDIDQQAVALFVGNKSQSELQISVVLVGFNLGTNCVGGSAVAGDVGALLW